MHIRIQIKKSNSKPKNTSTRQCSSYWQFDLGNKKKKDYELQVPNLFLRAQMAHTDTREFPITRITNYVTYVQAAVFVWQSHMFIDMFFATLSSSERKKKITKDEKKYHGSLNQQAVS